MQEAHEAVDRILAAHQPLPLDEDIDRELDRIKKKAADSPAWHRIRQNL
jgi:hypothetical protein